MNHNTKPHFQTVIDKQLLAQYHLTKNTRSTIEIAALERNLIPCPAADTELPRLPLVRLKKSDGPFTRWVVLGEVAQKPGKVILLDVTSGHIELSYSTDDLEIVPPAEFA